MTHRGYADGFDWKEVATWQWQRRNLAVWDAVTDLLRNRSPLPALSTIELANLLAGDGEAGALASVLTRSTVKLVKKEMVTQDGEEYEAYGKKYRRYRWHGQKTKELVI